MGKENNIFSKSPLLQMIISTQFQMGGSKHFHFKTV
jgi:hypothetical protein